MLIKSFLVNFWAVVTFGIKKIFTCFVRVCFELVFGLFYEPATLYFFSPLQRDQILHFTLMSKWVRAACWSGKADDLIWAKNRFFCVDQFNGQIRSSALSNKASCFLLEMPKMLAASISDNDTLPFLQHLCHKIYICYNNFGWFMNSMLV